MKRLPPPVLKVWPLKENPLGRLLSAGLGWIAGGWADMSWGILVQGMGWGVSFVVANQDHTGSQCGQSVPKGCSPQRSPVGNKPGPCCLGDWGWRGMVQGSSRWVSAKARLMGYLEVSRCSPEFSSVGTGPGSYKWGR